MLKIEFDGQDMGVIGTPTMLNDSKGDPIFVGDVLSTGDNEGLVCHENGEFRVMGWFGLSLQKILNEARMVVVKKHHTQVVGGIKGSLIKIVDVQSVEQIRDQILVLRKKLDTMKREFAEVKQQEHYLVDELRKKGLKMAD